VCGAGEHKTSKIRTLSLSAITRAETGGFRDPSEINTKTETSPGETWAFGFQVKNFRVGKVNIGFFYNFEQEAFEFRHHLLGEGVAEEILESIQDALEEGVIIERLTTDNAVFVAIDSERQMTEVKIFNAYERLVYSHECFMMQWSDEEMKVVLAD
jgi:uncharacterized protein YuzE